jgi:hypothetical protein
MSTIGRPRAGIGAAGGGAGEPAVFGAVLVALVPMGVLHVAGSAVVDPVTTVISDYVLVAGGYTLIGVSATALAAAGLVLASMVRSARLPHARTVTGLLLVWSAALVVVALFPTNAPGTPVDVTAWVHRVGGAVVFGVLPVIVALVARRAAELGVASAAALRTGALVSGAGTAVFLAAQVPVGFGLAPLLPFLGLLQRVDFAVVMVLLVALARTVAAAAQTVPAVAPAAAAPRCEGAA